MSSIMVPPSSGSHGSAWQFLQRPQGQGRRSRAASDSRPVERLEPRTGWVGCSVPPRCDSKGAPEPSERILVDDVAMGHHDAGRMACENAIERTRGSRVIARHEAPEPSGSWAPPHAESTVELAREPTGPT